MIEGGCSSKNMKLVMRKAGLLTQSGGERFMTRMGPETGTQISTIRGWTGMPDLRFSVARLYHLLLPKTSR